MDKHFYELDVDQRIALVLDAIERRRPLMIRWGDVEATFGAAWASRAAAAAHWLASATSVVDIGCGAMTLEGFLDPAQAYLPVDIAPRDGRTLVLDLNQPADLNRLPSADACALLGVLEYSYEPDLLLSALGRRYAQVVMSFNPQRNDGDIAHRLANGWVNHYTREELLERVTRHGFTVAREKLFDGKREERLFDFRTDHLGLAQPRDEIEG